MARQVLITGRPSFQQKTTMYRYAPYTPRWGFQGRYQFAGLESIVKLKR